MKQIKILLIVAIIFYSNYSFGQWQEINTIPSQYMESLNFITDDIGYVVLTEMGGSKTIEKTINGGNSWTVINMPVPSGDLQDVHFNIEGEGVAVVRDFADDAAPTKIYQTLNDGTNWQDISPDSTVAGIGNAQCQFLDQNIGFLSTGEKLYTTVDGGSNWNSYDLAGIAISMDFMDANHGIIGLFDGTFNYFGGMICTSDGGTTWNNKQLMENQTVIGEVMQIDENIAYAAPVKWGAANQQKFFKTIDNGINWDTMPVPNTIANTALSDIDFKDELNGAITVSSQEHNYIYKTTDGGATWELQNSTPFFGITDLELTTNSGYLSGGLGVFYKLVEPLSLKEPAFIDVNFYPNPVSSEQVVFWNSSEKFTSLSIFDFLGKKIHQQSLLQNNTKLPNLARGIYLLQLQNDQKIGETIKLVVE